MTDILNRVFIERQRSWRIVAETGVKPARPREPAKPDPPQA
ncbi:hypothetical protein [Brevundimonas sp. SL130]|nr:hypothetical protein [Brevundimonas sp. SL130]WAC58429.1 hypothetical protein OU998_09275 [Brevundimonas sp. SL130]